MATRRIFFWIPPDCITNAAQPFLKKQLTFFPVGTENAERYSAHVSDNTTQFLYSNGADGNAVHTVGAVKRVITIITMTKQNDYTSLISALSILHRLL